MLARNKSIGTAPLVIAVYLGFAWFAASVVLGLPLGTALAKEEKGLDEGSEVQIKIGSKGFTESVILGELLSHLGRSAGVSVEHRAELGGTQVLWGALKAGEIDIYVDYTGTIQAEILAKNQFPDEPQMRKSLAQQGIVMSERLGFNNTYALGMTRERASELGIDDIADLVKYPDLHVGLSDEFMERKDGWPGLSRAYMLPQRNVRGVDHNLAMRGLDSGAIDVSDLYSTDADIGHYGFVVLEDSKRFFPLYYAVVLYRDDLPRRAPNFVAAIEKLQGAIDTASMIEMNTKVRAEKRTEKDVAGEFVKSKLGIDLVSTGDEELSFWQRVRERLWKTTWQHLFLVSISLLAAIAIAIPLGIVAYRFPRWEQIVLGIVGVIQTLPSMALLVFMIPLLGLGAEPAIVALFLYSLLPIVRGTHSGLKQIAGSLKESAEVIGLPKRAQLFWVELPLASPAILSGIKTAAVINVGTATIGALIGAGGYGQPILTGIRLNDIPLILQGAIPAALLAILVQFGFAFIERWIVPRGIRLAAAQ